MACYSGGERNSYFGLVTTADSFFLAATSPWRATDSWVDALLATRCYLHWPVVALTCHNDREFSYINQRKPRNLRKGSSVNFHSCEFECVFSRPPVVLERTAVCLCVSSNWRLVSGVAAYFGNQRLIAGTVFTERWLLSSSSSPWLW